MLTARLRMRRRIRRCVAVTAPAAVALAFPLSAQALDPGVNYDPGGPAGKEYAIPLVSGRAEGAGTQDQRSAANQPFGAGIKPPGRGGGGGTAGHRGGGSSKSGKTVRPKTAGSRAGGRSARSSNDGIRDRLARAEQPGGTDLWTLGIALAVVLSATLLALLLHRRAERPVR
jgi:hypothetical protein